MNRSLTVFVVIVLAIVAASWLAGGTTVGQGPGGETDGTASARANRLTPVAVVDIKRIFKQHAAFQQRLADLGREVQAFSQNATVRQTEIESWQRRLPTLKPGSAEYEKAQLLLTRLQTELKLETTRRQQQFLKREMTLYNDTYSKISAAVTQYAKDNGIQLVLRSDEEKVNPEDQKSVLGAVNRMVVYQEGLDITDEILADLNSEEESPTEM